MGGFLGPQDHLTNKKRNDGPASLADVVRSVRLHLKLSQEKFAAKLGVSFPTVNRWENGRTRPSPLAIKRLEEIVRGLDSKDARPLRRYLDDLRGS